jgi:hypothetical protein
MKNGKSFSERFLKQFACPSINRRWRSGTKMFFVYLSAFCFFSEATYTPALHKSMIFYYPLITLLFAARQEIAGDLVLQSDWHSLSGSIHPEAW